MRLDVQRQWGHSACPVLRVTCRYCLYHLLERRRLPCLDRSGKAHVLQLDTTTGALTLKHVVANVVNPTFLAIHPSKKFLYSVGEIGNFGGQKAGALNAFAIGADGNLSLLNQESSGGPGPCHVSIDKTGRNLLAANYSGGSVCVLPIKEDGHLGPATTFIQHKGTGPNAKRQEGPHAHSINLDASNRYAFAADLGLDKVFIYEFDPAKGTLAPHGEGTLAPGAGPRHFAFHPNGKYAYVNAEMLSTVTAFAYENGSLKEIQTESTLPKDFKGNSSTAETQVSPDGKFLYVSNRGHDSIAIYSIDASTGKFACVGHQSTGGKTPRNFGIDPTGTFVLAANQGSDSVVVFKIDKEKGTLSETGHTIKVPKPVCVKFVNF